MMKNIRRSIKGDRNEHFAAAKVSHLSITPKSAITITPPKKVIKAVDSYQPSSDQELGFEKGDFFHVIGNENDPEWYEACNPASGARGFVPVPFFQVLGKNERDSQDSVTGLTDVRTDQDSGYSDRGMDQPIPIQMVPTSPPAKAPKAGSPLYGVVLYDFLAERPDELEAKQGEPIIVIAQSNDEWFVAKPIGRLGGPGLIPVDFIEIRDMVTNEPVEDTKGAIARAGVPRVEEWKKMAAEYKSSSIALGQFEFGDGSGSQQGNGQQRNTLQPYNANGSGGGGDNYRNSRGSTTGILTCPIAASVDKYAYENGRYWYQVNCTMEDGRSWQLCRFYEDFYDFQIALLEEFKEEAGHTGQPRTLPYMPGPVTYVTDTISGARRQSLDEYVKKLLGMPAYISKCRLVKSLFAPRLSDAETTRYQGNRLSGGNPRASVGSQQSSDSSRSPSRQTSSQNLNGSGPGYPGLSAPPPRSSNQQAHLRQPSEVLQPPRMLRQDSSMSAATSNSTGGFFKIKIEFEDELVAIRLPKDMNYAMLLDKLEERLGTTSFSSIRYRDEQTQEVYDLAGDDALLQAINRNPKLKLFVA